MPEKSFFSLFAIFVFAAASFAQAVHTPAEDSAERKAILNALRVPVEKELKQKIRFSIDNFRVQGEWAFVNGAPQNSAGGEPSYKNTPYRTTLRKAFLTTIFRRR